jgi:hypothetical protein
MGLQFAPTPAAELGGLIRFLSEAFRSDPQLNSFQAQVLQWKYFDPHPEWSQPRSFSLNKEQQIVAHGGIWPIRLRTNGAELQAINLIDWAASPEVLGAGVHVLKNIANMCDIMITVGGSPDTQRILPKLKYQRGGTLRRYVRVTRPWVQLRTRRQYDWKTPARLMRNSFAVLKPLPKTPASWRVEKVAQFGAEIESLLRSCVSSQGISPLRTTGNLNHMLACPASQLSAFVVFEHGKPTGYFVLSTVGRQARIVDFMAPGDDPALWRSICDTAAQTASRNPENVEIVAGTSSAEVGKAFEQLGFRLCRQDEILYYDRLNLLARGARLQLNLIDSDLSFMYNPNHPYIS